MADTKKGTVQWAGSKTMKGRTFYSFKLDDEFYRTGFDNTKVKQGDYIEFEFEVNQYGNQVDTSTVKVIEQTVEAPAAAVASKAKAGGKVKEDYVARDKYWTNKELMDIERQKIITYNAAVNSAINLATLAASQDALPSLGAKKADKTAVLQEVILKIADELAVKFMGAPAHVDELLKQETTQEVNTEGDIDDE